MAQFVLILYAAIAYGIFFATFLYLIAFVGDLPIIPTTVDTGVEGSLLTAIGINLALIALFGIQHSVMARKGFKALWTKLVPAPIERSTYVLFASAALIALFVFWRPIAGDVWLVENDIASALLWALFAIGWSIVLLSTFLLNHFELFGLQQVYFHARNRRPADPQLHEPLFYKVVRHPLYSGFFIAFWATPHMTVGHLLLAVGMSAYMLIAIRFEERDLVAAFGPKYEAYRERVGMLTPRLGKRKGSL